MFAKILHRPALAIVISLIILFLGGLGILTLPISQFPNVAPPRVTIFITYPGASAKVLTNSVLIPLETAINGVRNMRYIVSDATSAGEATIQVYFEPGTDPGLALVYVKSQISVVKKRLPPLVQREGILVRNVRPGMLMYVNLYSQNENADMKFLFNYAKVNLLPVLKRIPGVGRAKIIGSRQYAMRVWLDIERMRVYGISTEEVMKALEEQSVIGALGRLGRASGKESQSLEYVLTYEGRYENAEEYESIILKSTPEGETLRLGDVADVELGSEFYDIYSNIDGHPSAAIMLNQGPNSNATKVIERIKEKLKEIKAEAFPPGMDYKISYDVSQFLDASIEKVLHTLFEAFVLVSLVVFIFLGDWRSTLIPVLAVPVSLIGTFFVMMLLGISINLITLFALVLAIGIVVDDAIVVVEAVHAKMHESHLSPYRASMEVMHEISGAIIAITLVMVAVFVPVTFMTGPVGTFYRQFSITMVSAIIISAVVALTLTPVLCAMILKPVTGRKKKWRGPIALLLQLFNWAFEKVTGGYTAVIRRLVPRRAVSLLIILGFCAGIYVVNTRLPTSFIPAEDQGMLYAIVQTPPGSTLAYTNDKTKHLQAIAEEVEGISSVASLAGYEILTRGRGSNAGTCIINLEEWSEREMNSREIVEELEEKCREISGVKLEFFEPPPVPGYGTTGGLCFRLLDKTNSGDYEALAQVNDKFMAALKERKELAGLFTFFSNDYPQLRMIIDNKVAMQKGLSIGDIINHLSILIGSTYEQGFIRFGRFWKVYVQAAPEFRRLPKDLEDLFIANDRGEMVPYSSFTKFKEEQGMNEITRYNLYPSSAIRGRPAPGYSSGEAVKAIREVAAQTLPRGYDIGWENLTYDQARRGNMALYIFLIVVGFVYLVLVAQYESFMLPLAVILSLPIGVFGSFLCLKGMGLSNDVYAQVGLIMLVGLLGKNAILVIEFAVQRRQQGHSIKEAAIEGGKVRFRPILMTSFAFIVGLLPLVFASGAGAIGNRTIGTGAAGGMLVGTMVGVFVIPGLYYLFGKIADKRSLIKDEHDEPLSEMFEREQEKSPSLA